MIRRKFLTLALAISTMGAMPAFAAKGFVDYKPGLIKKELAAGKTVFVDYAAVWCGTCRAQERAIGAILSENPKYAKAMTFVRVDWDDYKNAAVTKDRKIPRRSTLIVLKGNKELGRIVAGTSSNAIKALMNRGL